MSRSQSTVSRPRTSETLEQRRQRTANARHSLTAAFPTPEDQREHLSRAGQIGNARRRVLSGDDVAALAAAYRTLDAIVKKYRIADDPVSGGGSAAHCNSGTPDGVGGETHETASSTGHHPTSAS